MNKKNYYFYVIIGAVAGAYIGTMVAEAVKEIRQEIKQEVSSIKSLILWTSAPSTMNDPTFKVES